jgi:cytochrome P450
MQRTPIYDIDFYADAVIADPYPHYKAMRDLGPAVWLPQNNAWAVTRYTDVRDALRNDAVFISGEGVMMNDFTNQASSGGILCADGIEHRRQRRMVATPLLPKNIETLKVEVQAMATARVDDLVARGRFDGVADFAHYLPLMVVSHLVGLPEEGREQMLEWAGHIFNTIGPLNARGAASMEQVGAAMAFVGGLDGASMTPGSWGAALFDLAERGELTVDRARDLMFSYVAPSLDTTINATSSALWLFGEHPDQWDAARADPALMSAAIEEAMRLESPIRAFSRVAAEDADVDGTVIPKGDRVLMVYASANRDERYWPRADRFDIRRAAPQEHMSMGTGAHVCVGMHLARLEMRCLFGALAAKAKRFETTNPTRDLHNVLRGLKSLDVRIVETA